MPQIFKATDIKHEDKEAHRDYFDRHTPHLFCHDVASRKEKFRVKVKVGSEYNHPDDPDHHIAYVQLWNREKLLAETSFPHGTLGNEKSQVEVDFYVIPINSMNLTAMSYCTQHGLWQSDPKEIKVVDPE